MTEDRLVSLAPPPRSPRAEAKRRQILAAAEALFGRDGFDRASMRELAAEAGVSTATLHAHFPRKEQLLDAVLEALFERTSAAILEGVKAHDDPLERLVMGLQTVHSLFNANPLVGRAVTQGDRRDPVLHERLRWIQERLDGLGVLGVKAAVAAGRFACSDPEAFIVVMRSAMVGWWVSETPMRQPVSLQRAVDMVLFLVRGREIPAPPEAGGSSRR